MISTVTTTTVTTVTTTALAGSLGLIAVLALFALLVQKEVLTASQSRFSTVLSRVLNVGLIPLLMAFGMIVVAKLMEVLC